MPIPLMPSIAGSDDRKDAFVSSWRNVYAAIASLSREHASAYVNVFGNGVEEIHRQAMMGTIAASHDHLDVLRLWMQAHPMALDISYDTGLLRGLSIGHVAAAHGHASSMMAWIAAGGDLQRRSDNGSSMGHIAAERDRLEVLAAWIRAGGDVHARDVRGRTIGHVCASLPCLDQWMSAGGDINALDFSGRTIGHAAGADGHVDVCQAWLQHATTVTPVDHDGSTVLHHIMDPCRGIQIMDAWIARGGDIHICNHRHESIGFHLLDRGAMSWCTAWINRGGCILDGIRHPDVHMLMTRHGDDGEGMVVTRAFLRMADGACTITDHERQAMHGPIGRPLAQRLMLHAQDPVHLARFIQAWESIP